MRHHTLVTALQDQAIREPHRPLYTFLENGEGPGETLDPAAVDRRARAIAEVLAARVAPGERVLLLYTPGLEYVVALFACLYARVVAVPVYPPDPTRLDRSLRRLLAILADAQASWILTDGSIYALRDSLNDRFPALRDVHWLATSGIDAASARELPPPRPDELAFLQYTSGSTGTPKGVELSHANLIHNLAAGRAMPGIQPGGTSVAWIPLFHDMGLIAGVFGAIEWPSHFVFMSPIAFLERPARWLEAITRFRGNHSAAPDFAYELCTKRIGAEERARLDLRSWTVALNGAEPVRHATLRRFAEAFAPCGFRAEAFRPAYGLAEATLLVTVSAPEPGWLAQPAPPSGVSLGPASRGLDLRIVDPQTRVACADGDEGEIWLRGASVAQGYWNDPIRSAEHFDARLADSGDGPFLRTGDLGTLRDGELRVTGRIKDLLVLGGSNHHPQDLEATLQQRCDALRPGCGAAFGVEVEGRERLVIAHEIRPSANDDTDRVFAAMRAALAEEHELVPHALVLLAPGSLPKTSSGKLQRHAARREYLDGGFAPIAVWPSEAPRLEQTERRAPTPLEAEIAALCAEQLGVADVRLDDDFFALGGHSMLATQTVARLRERFGVELPLRTLFDAPSVAGMARSVEAARRAGRAPAPPLARRPGGSPAPLSSAQERIWFLEQLDPGTAAFHIAAAVELRGSFDANRLLRALRGVVSRHEALRTRFEAADGRPLARIARDAELDFAAVDLRARSAPADAAERALAELARAPFDLARGPLLRVRLWTLGDDCHRLALVVHHAVSDGPSIGVLLREVEAAYAADGPPPGDAPLQYGDYARHERSARSPERRAALIDWWRGQLDGAAPLELPVDRPRSPQRSRRGRRLHFRFDARVAADLEALARREGATLPMLVLAGFACLLARYADQEELVLGTAVSARTRPELDGVVGCFVNPLPLRVDLSGDPSFRELVARVRETLAGAIDHQDLPFEELVGALGGERDLSRHPLFDVICAFHEAPFGSRWLGLDAQRLPADVGSVHLDLSLHVTRGAAGLEAELEYATDLFDADRIERAAGHLRELLASAVEAPDRPIGALRLLGASERESLLALSRGVPAPELAFPSLLHWLEAACDAGPDAVALRCEGAELRYRELDARANRLAHALVARGVGAGDVVGLALERSFDLVAAALAAWKAGAAYLPLDPMHPDARIADMVEDAGACCVVTQQSQQARLPASVPTLNLDADADTIARQPATRLPVQVDEQALAFLLYTSGSTGRPKGCMVTRQNLHCFVANCARSWELGPGDVWPVFQSLGFDIAAACLWTSLACGGRAVLVPEATTRDFGAFYDLLCDEGATLTLLTASTFHELVKVDAQHPRASELRLRHALFGGERASYDGLATWLAQHPLERTGLGNIYGPTETTIWMTEHRVTRAQLEARDVGCIGRPTPGSSVYVLDSKLRLQPLGVPGELCVGGAQVCRGYRNRPELDAERFVANPFEPGDRLYRTGDRGLLRRDGNLEIHGRIDLQVKLRGHRIELGEIEAVLGTHPSVSEVAVVLRRDVPGNPQLVAYCVPDGELPARDNLRDFLRERLPDHMVPARFVALDRLPLTKNGKLDRSALPAPRATADQRGGPAQTPTEARLLRIFEQVLGLKGVGREDDFFDLGGHSLLATRITARVRSELGVELPVRRLFEARSVAALARALDALPRAAGAERIPTIARNRRVPLSPAQERLWFLEQLDPDNTSYNIAGALRLRGRLDADALRQALASIVLRHESLRTSFEDHDGVAAQRIHPEPRFEFARRDLRAQPDPAGAAQALLGAFAQRPFDLASDPLLRVLVAQLGDDEHAVGLSLHHIVCDGWSLGILTRELAAAYDRARNGGGEEPAPLPIQYADYAVWQRQEARAAENELHLAYWRERLADLPALALPSDRPRPPVRSFRGRRHRFTLPEPLVRGLEQIGHAHGASPFMVLLAGFQCLLSRYSGQDDVAIGVPVAGRDHPDTEGLIGMFVNTLVARTRFDGDPSFAALLERVRDGLLLDLEHRTLPFEALVDALAPRRDLSRNPLYQVMLTLLPAENIEFSLAGLAVEPAPLDSGRARMDLILELSPDRSGALAAEIEYATDLYDTATIERFAQHYATLLQGVVDDPSARVSELPLLTPAEREQVLVRWQDTARTPLTELGIHQLFEERARRHPDRIALRGESRSYSYGELDQLANGLAHRLVARGVAPDDAVAVYLERSAETVIGLLAVLKAGAGYLPLDRDFPPERRAFTLTDTGVRHVLVDPGLRGELPPGLDLIEPDGSRADAPPPGFAGPDTLAYIIYTSGSTGKPKGVEVPHRSPCRVLRGHFREDDVVGVTALLNFDVSVEFVFGALASGASVVVLPRCVTTSPPDLTEAIERYGITALDLTTPLFHSIANEMPDAFRTLRRLEVGGEAMDPGCARRVLRHGPPQQLWNVYGPTETFVTSHFEVNGLLDSHATVPIGRAWPHSRIYVLDPWLRPMPIGVPGEIWIGGVGVLRGYRNRPDVTRERFVADPFCDAPGARLYRTGDRGRFLPDGNIEFLGRVDRQLKIRGYRIEPGEIEATLTSHPEVVQAAVVAWEPRAGDRELAGYVRLADGASLTEDALRAWLRRSMPDYMVPPSLMLLDEMPLTATGKLDRAALPLPNRVSSREFVAPQGALEDRLAALWRELLGSERVGAHDDFFELGGHSLIATRIVARVRRELGARLQVRDVFEAPTVAALARRIEASDPAHDAAPAPHGERGAPAPLTFSQERLWFLERLEPGSPAYHIAGALRLRGPLDRDALRGSLERLVRRHGALRTVFREQDGSVVQQVDERLELELMELDVSDRRDPIAEALRQARAEARAPFDLERDAPLRVTLWRIGEQDHLLALVLHHIAGDGWSLSILSRELCASYNDLRACRVPSLPPLAHDYADFARWQRATLQGAELDRRLARWREELAGLPMLELPTDRARPASPSYRGDDVPVRLSHAASVGVERLARECGATPFMVLLATWQCLLARYSGQHDFAVGTTVANRTRSEWDGVVGLFVNALVLRADLAGDPSFAELVARVRERTLAAFEEQDLPFERLVEALAPRRDLSRNPLFQTLFILQNAPESAFALGGLVLEPVALPTATAKFDLSLELVRGEGGYEGRLEYAGDLFERERMLRMARHLEQLVARAVAEPERPLAAIDMLEPEERRALLADAGAGVRSEVGPTLLERFERQAARTPDAIALDDGARTLRYGELARAAHAVAAALAGAGVSAGARVGLRLDRSIEAVIAILGVWKAGGCYVPLDIDSPAARLQWQLDDVGAALLLTARALCASFETPLPTLLVEDALAGAVPTAEPGAAPRPEDVAYVLYTSGSTGRPKGVLIEHRAASVRMQHEPIPFAADEVTVFKTGLGFVDSVWECFAALVRGLRALVVPEATLRDPEAFVRALAEGGVTRITLVPSLLALLLDAHPDLAERLPRLRLWSATGEPLRRTLCERFLAQLPGRRLVNLYGTTEVWDASWEEIERVPATQLAPIGRPLPYVRAYALDAAGRLVPRGLPGELCIGGPGLARGYAGRPELDRQRFVDDPFVPGERLYRSGDRVRLRRDGGFEFLGRLDFQLKVRGRRIDPAEIEGELDRHPGVTRSVVVARGEAESATLVCYLGGPVPLAESELRAYAARRLPAALVPDRFVWMKSLPVGPGGKIDRAALPEPGANRSGVAPRDALERRIAALWQQALDLPEVPVDVSFFELGGSSLVAMRIWSRLCAELGSELPLAAFFQLPTVEAQAALLRGRETAPRRCIVPMRGLGEASPLVLVHPAGGHVLGYADLLRRLAGARSVFGVQSPALFEPETAPVSVEEQARRYVRELEAVCPRGEPVIGGVSFGGLVALEMARELRAAGRQVPLVVLFDTWVPGLASSTLDATKRGVLLRVAAENGIALGSEVEGLDDDALFEHVVARARELRQVSEALRDDEIRRVLATYQANLAAAAVYRPQPYDGDVVLYEASEQRALHASEGWRRWLVGRFETHEVPGGHHSLLLEPHVRVLARDLSRRLAAIAVTAPDAAS